MDVHADVNVGYQQTAAACLDLLALAERIDTPDYQGTPVQRLRAVLPSAGVDLYVYRNYERLPAEIQADLPLKRVWMLVPEDRDA
jgi:hypothetical protein